MNAELKYFGAALLIISVQSFGATLIQNSGQLGQASQDQQLRGVYPPAPLKSNMVFEIDNRIYHAILNQSVNWYEAFQFCRRQGWRLASPLFRSDNTELKNFMKARNMLTEGTRGVWVSLNDLEKQDSYTWMSTGTSAYYYDWSAGEPNNKDEHCVEMRLKNNIIGWNDLPCWVKTSLLCEQNLI